MNQDKLRRILTDRNLAQLGDSVLNFALSAALTRATGNPMGRRVKNSLLTPLIDSSPLKMLLPLRTSRRDRANAFEALAGYLWLKEVVQTDELIEAMVSPFDPLAGDSEPERLSLQAVFKLLVDRIESPQSEVTAKT